MTDFLQRFTWMWPVAAFILTAFGSLAVFLLNSQNDLLETKITNLERRIQAIETENASFNIILRNRFMTDALDRKR